MAYCSEYPHKQRKLSDSGHCSHQMHLHVWLLRTITTECNYFIIRRIIQLAVSHAIPRLHLLLSLIIDGQQDKSTVSLTQRRALWMNYSWTFVRRDLYTKKSTYRPNVLLQKKTRQILPINRALLITIVTQKIVQTWKAHYRVELCRCRSDLLLLFKREKCKMPNNLIE